MKFIKKYFKLFIGCSVLIMGIFVFLLAQRGGNLESGTLQNWKSASAIRRFTAVQVLNASDENIELIVSCVDKMSKLPNSADFVVSDAVRLCTMGIQLKTNN